MDLFGVDLCARCCFRGKRRRITRRDFFRSDGSLKQCRVAVPCGHATMRFALRRRERLKSLPVASSI